MLRDQKDGYDVFWTYAPMPNLSVNGMFVTNSSTRHKFGRRGRRHWSQGQQTATDFKCAWAKFSIGHPKLCISDPDGRFPLNLQRTNISEPSYPFLDQLLTDVVDDYLAYLLVNGPESPMGAVDSVERRHDYGSKVRSRHAGVSVDISKNAVGATYSVFPFVVNHCGFGLDFVATDGVADRACNVLITSSPGDLDLMTAPDGTCMLYRPDSLPETWATILVKSPICLH